MCTERIHECVHDFLGIVLRYREDAFHKVLGIVIYEIINDCLPEGIVHYTVELFPEQVFASYTVSGFCGGVLPDFSEKEGIRIFGFYTLTYLNYEFIRKLIGNVKAEAVCSRRIHFAITPFLPVMNSMYDGFVSSVSGRVSIPHQEL